MPMTMILEKKNDTIVIVSNNRTLNVTFASFQQLEGGAQDRSTCTMDGNVIISRL